MYNYNHKLNHNLKFLRKYLLIIEPTEHLNYFPIQFKASKEEVKRW